MAIGAITRRTKGTRSLHICFASYKPVNSFQPQNMTCCIGKRLCEHPTSGSTDVSQGWQLIDYQNGEYFRGEHAGILDCLKQSSLFRFTLVLRC